MGTWNRYFCRKCPYEAFVSGENDVGMAAATSTVRRYDCKEIKDVVTTEEPWLAMDKGWVPAEFYCDRSATHQMALWVGRGECPKCSYTMEVDPTVDILWDRGRDEAISQ